MLTRRERLRRVLQAKADAGDIEAAKALVNFNYKYAQRKKAHPAKFHEEATVHPGSLEFHARAFDTAIDCLNKKLDTR